MVRPPTLFGQPVDRPNPDGRAVARVSDSDGPCVPNRLSLNPTPCHQSNDSTRNSTVQSFTSMSRDKVRMIAPRMRCSSHSQAYNDGAEMV